MDREVTFVNGVNGIDRCGQRAERAGNSPAAVLLRVLGGSG